ncbi:uncharacterized protein B0T15DRAFT_500139 [Chaetomium strumarium]|uniref:Uncharacterized protein n=1 Tax=Chaetomium strumarium TaxID=1170767 RepID=A0AAJ0GY26_9PEZI|nr:hypothetical protein B0T15DRAFT_500139 [Chaetomium strumarium]
MPTILIVVEEWTEDSRKRWQTVVEDLKRFIDILQSFVPTAGHMTAIALFSLGFDKFGDNPNTVYIALDYESPEVSWPPILAKLREYIDGYGLGLHVHLEHNVIRHSAFQYVPPKLTEEETLSKIRDYNYRVRELYTTRVRAGADIGAARYIDTEGGRKFCPIEIHLRAKRWNSKLFGLLFEPIAMLLADAIAVRVATGVADEWKRTRWGDNA